MVRIQFAMSDDAFSFARRYLWPVFIKGHQVHIMYIEASPRGPQSRSSDIAAEFLQHIKMLKPGFTIDHLHLWTEELPAFDGPALAAKYATLAAAPLNKEEQEAWRLIAALVERLDAADALLISTPMWNLGIPYRLKHFFDLVTQPGLSFRFDPAAGYTPLLRARPTAVFLASSGDFSGGESYGRPDLASDYLRAALSFIGFDGADIVPVSPTAEPPGKIEAGMERARARCAILARHFAGATP